LPHALKNEGGVPEKRKEKKKKKKKKKKRTGGKNIRAHS